MRIIENCAVNILDKIIINWTFGDVFMATFLMACVLYLFYLIPDIYNGDKRSFRKAMRKNGCSDFVIDYSDFDVLNGDIEEYINEQGYTLGDKAELYDCILHFLIYVMYVSDGFCCKRIFSAKHYKRFFWEYKLKVEMNMKKINKTERE